MLTNKKWWFPEFKESLPSAQANSAGWHPVAFTVERGSRVPSQKWERAKYVTFIIVLKRHSCFDVVTFGSLGWIRVLCAAFI